MPKWWKMSPEVEEVAGMVEDVEKERRGEVEEERRRRSGGQEKWRRGEVEEKSGEVKGEKEKEEEEEKGCWAGFKFRIPPNNSVAHPPPVRHGFFF